MIRFVTISSKENIKLKLNINTNDPVLLKPESKRKLFIRKYYKMDFNL